MNGVDPLQEAAHEVTIPVSGRTSGIDTVAGGVKDHGHPAERTGFRPASSASYGAVGAPDPLVLNPFRKLDSVLMHREDERQLVRALLVRDRAAWIRFVDAYQGLVRARIVRTAAETQNRLGPADLDDVCAEVFAGLLANDLASLRRFEGRSSLATWLSVVARRACLRWLDQRCTAAHSLDDHSHAADEAAVRCQPPDVLGKLIDGEDADRLAAMLGKLNEADRTVLQLFYMHGCSYAEIGRRLRISINSVGAKLHRAQQRLRRLVDLPEVVGDEP